MRIAMVVAGALLAWPGSGSAAEWVKVSESTTAIWYVDMTSMRQNGDVRSAWLKADHSRDRKTKARESRWLERFNCSAWTSRTASVTYYGPDGDVQSSRAFPEFESIGFTPIVPDTVWNGIARFVCS
ncbi:MAG TPA: surface-adhesin E family protein [Allosphingosinicella sp.]|jgi:hypothetical protein